MNRSVACRIDAQSGVASIVFDRPDRLNAIDQDMADGFAAAVAQVTARGDVRCVVLRGAGRAFMAGGDVACLAGPPSEAATVVAALLDAINPALVALRDVEASILAGVQGVAAGGGLSIALSADIVLAAEDARFVMAYDRLGAAPDCGGSWFLPRKAGTGRAAEMMMLSRELTAREAMAWGLVNEIAPADGFDTAIDALAARLAAGPCRAHAAYRRLSDSAFGRPLADHLAAERAAFLEITRSRDFAEGTAAFLEKRAPRFSGR